MEKPKHKKHERRIIVAMAIVVAAVASVQLYLRRETIQPLPMPAQTRPEHDFSGVRRSSTVPATEAAVEDDAEVIGVSVKGRHRAYCTEAMKSPGWHVVNDLIDRVPVTVTYCPRTKCVRALTQDDESDKPLSVVGSGWHEGKMMLSHGGEALPQDAESIPGLKDMEVETTTWKAWMTAHPDTDIYGARLGHAGVASG
jgi:hypothetical protein